MGGQTTGSRILGDTWALDDAGWREIPDESPGGRRFPTIAAVGGSVALFGGIQSKRCSRRTADLGAGYRPMDPDRRG